MKLDTGIQISIDKGVYTPSDDTFLLLSAIEVEPGQSALELGTGSGIVALHLAKAGCRITAADVSPEALECARRNAESNDLAVEFVQSDLFDNLPGKYDVIVFNPPYLSSADSEVLTESERKPLVGGEKGHEISARFLEQGPHHLNDRGRIYLLTSSESVDEVFRPSSNRFAGKIVAEQRMFFEALAVWELKLAKP